MSEGKETKLLELDPNNAWGLNMVNCQYAKESSEINKSLQVLMDQLSDSVAEGAKALYGVGGAILLSSVCEAATNVGGSVSALYAGRESGLVEKEQSEKIQKLDEKLVDVNEQLKKPGLAQPKKEELLNKKDELKSQKDKAQNKIQNSYTKTQSKMNAYQMMAQGLGSIPKGIQDSLQQKGNADKSSFDAVEKQASAAYDTQKSILRGFIDIDYFAGLTTIANVQLR
jgi:hypothetical protein